MISVGTRSRPVRRALRARGAWPRTAAGPDMKRPPARTTWSEGVCAPGRTRTCGQALRRRLLYPLSYGGRVWWPLSWVPGCGPFRDVAGDKDRAPTTLSLLLRLRGSMWRFSEAVLIIAGRYESCIAFAASRTGCCALVMPASQSSLPSLTSCRRADMLICFRIPLKLGILHMW